MVDQHVLVSRLSALEGYLAKLEAFSCKGTSGRRQTQIGMLFRQGIA